MNRIPAGDFFHIATFFQSDSKKGDNVCPPLSVIA